MCSIDCLKRVILNQTAPVPNRTGSDVSPCLQLSGTTWVHSKRCACETMDLSSLYSMCVYTRAYGPAWNSECTVPGIIG